MEDFEIIKQIERKLNIKLNKLNYSVDSGYTGYAVNNEGKIKGLSLTHSNLKKIDHLILYLKDLPQLRELNFSENQLTDISALQELKNITSLSLRSNEIADINPLKKLTFLRALDLYHNKVEDISPINELKLIEYLILHYNPIENISTLNELISLKEFYFIGGNIQNISFLKKSKKIRSIVLEHNLISDISPLIELMELRNIVIGYNNISDISALLNLKELFSIDLNNNKIRDISCLKGLSKLRRVNLINNNISKIPEWITDFTLDVQWNEITSDGQINFYSNPIKYPPLEIVQQGKNAIRNYFEQIKNPKDYLYEAKLLLVGEERAGKSTISDALCNPNFSINFERPSTHGMHISQWIIPKEKTKTEKDFNFNVWDFGGQEIYHATHQFFLTKRSLYLFITEARKDLRYDDFYYWLNIINTLAGDSPVILVQNKADQDHKNQNIDEYRNLFPQIAGELQAISCNNKHDDWEAIYRSKFELLKENIFKIIKEKKLKGIGDELPKVWVDIRKAINGLQQKDINYITQNNYIEICSEKGLNKEQALFLSDYFHDLGVFLHFRNDIQLRNTIFINHQWITKAIYNVFDNKKVKNAHGKFNDQDLIEIWNDPKFSGKQAELLNLMKNPQFKICYQHENKYYLAPQLFDVKPLQYEWNANGNSLSYRYLYEFMPKGILSQLIVTMHKYIYKDTFWLHGVLFEYKNSKAIVKEDRFSKNNLISIQVIGEAKKELLSVIIANIDKINSSYTNLKITTQYGCNCNKCISSDDPHYYSFETLNNYLKAGENIIKCSESIKNVEIRSLLGEYVPHQQLEDHISNHSQIKIKIKIIKIFLASSSELNEDREKFELFINRENKQRINNGIFLELNLWEDFIDFMSQSRLQDEYNKTIINSDIFVSLFFTKTGKYTEEEFDKAFGQFKKTNSPLIFTYFSNKPKGMAEINKDDINSKFKFEEKLKSLGHYPTTYENTDDLINQFRTQLARILYDLFPYNYH